MFQITDVKIALNEGNSGKLKAFATMTLDDAFVVRDIKVIDGKKGLFVAMPCVQITEKCPNCGRRNVVHSRYCSNCGRSLMEPREGTFNFAWLDRAISVLAGQDIDIILGTPTAAPPPWLMSKQDDLFIVNQDGRRLTYGLRREYCPNNPLYRQHTKQIVNKMAAHYADHPAVPFAQTVANLNMDMVGRARGDTVFVHDFDIGALDSTAAALAPEVGVTAVPLPWPEYRLLYYSDHLNFVSRRVPSMLFSSGFHPDYHMPSDEMESINYGAMEKIARLAFRVGVDVANAPERPAWQAPPYFTQR